MNSPHIPLADRLGRALSAQRCLFAIQQVDGASIFDLAHARVVAFVGSHLGREAWRITEHMPKDRAVFVATDGLDWRAYVHGQLCAEARSLPTTKWTVPEVVTDLLGSKGASDAANHLLACHSPNLVKEWVRRIEVLRVQLGTAAKRSQRKAVGIDELIWGVIVSLFHLRLREAGCGVFEGSPTHVYLALTGLSKVTKGNQRQSLREIGKLAGLSELNLPSDIMLQVTKSFAAHGAGPLLGKHLGFIYEDALARRVSSASSELAMLEIDRKKRQEGVYYTPSDVVAFICDNALKPQIGRVQRNISLLGQGRQDLSLSEISAIRNELHSLRVVDPSVGGGEFLRQALLRVSECYRRVARVIALRKPRDSRARAAHRRLLRELSKPRALALARGVYGIDIDAQAAKLCALNLLSEAADELKGSTKAWDRLLLTAQSNVRRADTVHYGARLLPGGDARMLRGFPGDFATVLSNPPYRRLSRDERRRVSLLGFETATAGDLYAIFVEASLAMLRSGGTYGAIVPLSVAFSEDMRDVRGVLMRRAQRIDLFHFDNIPDTIFRAGKPENQNTNLANSQRATIVVAHKDDGSGLGTIVTSTDLFRWRAVERPALFSGIRSCDVTALHSIQRGFPKLGDRRLVALMQRILNAGSTIGDAIDATGSNRLYLPSTARYFIGAVTAPLGRSGEIELSFASARVRAGAMVALNSSLFYWFWRVWGDGFHVTRRLVELFCLPRAWIESPAGDVEMVAMQLQIASSKCQVRKLNAGKVVVNVNFNLAPDVIAQADAVYLRALGSSVDLRELVAWYKKSSYVSVGGTECSVSERTG